MAGPDDLATGFLEIDGDSVTIDSLNAAQTPIGLVGVANDGENTLDE